MIKTTFAGASPWDGLAVSNASKSAKEKPMAPRRKPPQVKIESRAKSNAALKAAKKVAPKGRRNHMAVLTEKQAMEIVWYLKRYREIAAELKRISPPALALRYGVAENTIRHINDGNSWVHISGFTKREPVKK